MLDATLPTATKKKGKWGRFREGKTIYVTADRYQKLVDSSICSKHFNVDDFTGVKSKRQSTYYFILTTSIGTVK